MNTNGNAIGTAQFQYINLWSSPWTWGGNSPPEAGTLVVIDSGNTIYFDTTTPVLKAIVIDNASLIFDDNQYVALNAEYILVVNGGLFQVGTESSPFQHQAIITMYGQLRSIELPICMSSLRKKENNFLNMKLFLFRWRKSVGSTPRYDRHARYRLWSNMDTTRSDG